MLPLLLDAHLNQDAEDLLFWLDIARHNDLPYLELGCGTGRVLFAVARIGKTVYGLDRDWQMITFLKENLPAEIKSQVHVIQAQMNAFSFEIRFGMITLPCNTYSTLPFSERKTTLKNVFRHLVVDGVFAASVPNPNRLAGLAVRGETELEGFFPHPLDNEPVHIFSAWEKTADNVTMHWHYDHLQPDGNIQRTSTSTQHHLISKDAYIKEIQEAGFTEHNIYGDYDYSAYNQDSPYLIITAYK